VAVFFLKVVAMTASRLVNLLLVLQARGGLTTAHDLAEELEVSVRTVYRDLQALATAGVPLYGLAGPGGGYRLVDGYRTRLTGLTGAEAEALLLVDLSAPFSALGLGSDLVAARLKLTAALPEAVRARAGELAGRVHLDFPRWFEEAESPPALPELTAAVLNSQCVRFSYDKRGKRNLRVVEPLGLVLKGRSWYLVARSGDRMLTFSVGSITQLELTDEPVVRPDDFDLAATWARLVTEFEVSLPSVQVVVRAAPEALARLPRLVDTRAREQTDWNGEPDPDGWRRVAITFERLEYAQIGLLGLGASVEVLEPAELREAIASVVGDLAQLYRVAPAVPPTT
jgi:predicted DNA-binding transcriptional regulator YafY